MHRCNHLIIGPVLWRIGQRFLELFPQAKFMVSACRTACRSSFHMPHYVGASDHDVISVVLRCILATKHGMHGHATELSCVLGLH